VKNERGRGADSSWVKSGMERGGKWSSRERSRRVRQELLSEASAMSNGKKIGVGSG